MDAMEHLLEFGMGTQFRDLPPAVIERTRMAVLDTLGTAIAGTRGESVSELTSLACHWGGTPEATLITNGARLPLPLAVMVNATAARAWDLDDVHEQNTCHVNVSTVPAALAVAEARAPVNGRELIAAMAVGSELICRMSTAPRIGFGETGSSMSYQCAFYGVALTASRLIKLSKSQARHALGIAHARAGGNQQGFLTGAMTVKLMQGMGAEGGVIAALMAERNLTGSVDVLEGRFGYYQVFHRGRYEPQDLTRALGVQWFVNDVSIKPLYPCCKFIHGPIDAALQAVADAGIGADEIEHVRVVVTNKEVYDLVCTTRERKWNPTSVTDAQFSLPYMLAWAMVHRGIAFESVCASSLGDPVVKALMARIEIDLQTGAQTDGRGTFPMPGIVTVIGRDGRETQRTVEYVKGHPKNPMNYDDVAEKFLACARFGRPGWKDAEQLVERVSAIEKMDDCGELVRLCAGNE
jgi:2-methylcitrate dehydratase PrpD